MKAIYDYETDTLPVIFSEAPVAEGDEDKEGVILDYDACGNVKKILHHRIYSIAWCFGTEPRLLA